MSVPFPDRFPEFYSFSTNLRCFNTYIEVKGNQLTYRANSPKTARCSPCSALEQMVNFLKSQKLLPVSMKIPCEEYGFKSIAIFTKDHRVVFSRCHLIVDPQNKKSKMSCYSENGGGFSLKSTQKTVDISARTFSSSLWE